MDKMKYYAYDHNLPCRNPNCKSHGKPHPGCLCYGGGGAGDYAQGGEVKHFCSTSQAHKPECEYFQAGGDTLNFDSLSDDTTPTQQQPQQSLNFDQFKDDQPKFDDLKADTQQFDDMKDDSQKPDTLMGKINAGIEGAFVGQIPVIGRGIEHAVGMKPEQSEANYPGSFETGKLIGTAMSPMSIIKGGMWLKGAVQAGAIEFDNELANYMSGQKHLSKLEDDEVAAMHILGAAGVGAGGGFLLDKAAPIAGAIKDKISNRVAHFAAGIGDSIEGEFTNLTNGWYAKGHAFGAKVLPLFNNALSRGAAGYLGGGELGEMAGGVLDDITGNKDHKWALRGGNQGAAAGAILLNSKLTPMINKYVSKASEKIAGPILLKALQEGETSGVSDALEYGAKAASGQKYVSQAINNLFNAGAQQLSTQIKLVSDADKEKLKKFIDNGGINPILNEMKSQQLYNSNKFAHGGEVKASPLESNLGSLYPEQNILQNSAKSRASNYLLSLKPQDKPKMPFDKQFKDHESERKYDQAIHLAIQPLHILNHIKNGRLLADHMAHLNAMYPEVTKLLKKKITEKITEQQIKDERSSYAMRQSMSLFLGAPLDSTLTSASISAAQCVFSAPAGNSRSTQASAPKGKPGKLAKVANNAMTPDQAALNRQQNAR